MKCCLFWNWWMLQQSKNMELMNNLNFNWDLLSYFKVILLRNKIWLISFVLYCQISCQNVLQLVIKKRMDKWTWRQTVHLINTGSSSKRLLLPIIHFDWFSHTHTLRDCTRILLLNEMKMIYDQCFNFILKTLNLIIWPF